MDGEKVILETRCGCTRLFELESAQDKDFVVIALRPSLAKKGDNLTKPTLELKRVFRRSYMMFGVPVYIEEF